MIQCQYCDQQSDTLRGWKRHMSSVHGGYNDEDLAAVTGVPGEQDVRSRMESYARDVESGGTQSEEGNEAADQSATINTPTPTPGKRAKATPKKVKKLIASIPERMLALAEITPDNEDKEAMNEAADFLTDVFGVEFEVPESKYVVHSRWLAFLWVAGIIGLITVKHKFPQILKQIRQASEASAEKQDV